MLGLAVEFPRSRDDEEGGTTRQDGGDFNQLMLEVSRVDLGDVAGHPVGFRRDLVRPLQTSTIPAREWWKHLRVVASA
jgi:hypothetical protein